MTAAVVSTVRCVWCWRRRSEWPADHPRHDPDGIECGPCIQADIDRDTAHRRRAEQ